MNISDYLDLEAKYSGHSKREVRTYHIKRELEKSNLDQISKAIATELPQWAQDRIVRRLIRMRIRNEREDL